MNINDKINFLVKKNMPVDIPNLIIDDSTDLVEDIGMDSLLKCTILLMCTIFHLFFCFFAGFGRGI